MDGGMRTAFRGLSPATPIRAPPTLQTCHRCGWCEVATRNRFRGSSQRALWSLPRRPFCMEGAEVSAREEVTGDEGGESEGIAVMDDRRWG